MRTYEEYEKKCKKQEERNNEFLKIFEEDLRKAGLSNKTISRHVENAEFYINEYLFYEEPWPMEKGCSELDMFFGDFFIRKCIWSTPATIKSTAASLKKFYKCMYEHGCLKKELYDTLCYDIKESMEDWQDECARFNDGDFDF